MEGREGKRKKKCHQKCRGDKAKKLANVWLPERHEAQM